jgi:hypothetical protein
VVTDWLAEQAEAATQAGATPNGKGTIDPRKNGRGPAAAELTSMEIE